MTDFTTDASVLRAESRTEPTAAPCSPLAPLREPDERAAPRERGFTLIEIMAVVVIMGMLMATLAVGISGQIDRANMNTAKTQITRIEQSLEFYKLDNKRFPTADQGLDALIHKPSSPPIPRDYNPAGYIKREALLDPWDGPFQYRIPGTNNPYTFDLWSFGPDGVESEDDIRNWSDGEGV